MASRANSERRPVDPRSAHALPSRVMAVRHDSVRPIIGIPGGGFGQNISCRSECGGARSSHAGVTCEVAAIRKNGMSSRDTTSNPGSLDALAELAYHELRKVAHLHLAARRELAGGDRTLDTTALVHEAYLKLAAGSPSTWRDETH